MSPSLPAPPCSEALLWLGALALGGAIACATPVPAAPTTTALSEATGTQATPAVPAKASPYAAAKDEDSSSDSGLPGNDRFWALLIPIGVAAVLYGALRQQEGRGA